MSDMSWSRVSIGKLRLTGVLLLVEIHEEEVGQIVI